MTLPIVFIHGAFCGGWAFDAFRKPFAAAGYETHAPHLLHHERGADYDLLAQTGVRDYAEGLVRDIRRLNSPPVLVGHSLGGLVAQLVAARTPVAGLILLAPSAPWGVLPTTLDEHGNNFGLSLLGDYWRRTVPPDYRIARHSTLDRLDSTEARRFFGKFTHESGRAVMEAVQWWLDPTMASAAPVYRISCPILAMTGGRDRVNPSSTVRRILNRFPAARTSFQEFPDMSHWLIGEPEWPEVAATALAWLNALGLSPAANVAVKKRRFVWLGAGSSTSG
jgi:pimeloyl-ACP methyl ester carboxylesterase